MKRNNTDSDSEKDGIISTQRLDPAVRQSLGHRGVSCCLSVAEDTSLFPSHLEVGKHRTDTSMTVFLKSSLKEINDFLQAAMSDLGLGIDKFIYSGARSPFFS